MMASPPRSRTFKEIELALINSPSDQASQILRHLKASERGWIACRPDRMPGYIQEQYGPSSLDKPQVYDDSHLPWKKMPTINETRILAQKALKNAKTVDYKPSKGDQKNDRWDAETLIKSLNDERIQGKGCVQDLLCPELGTGYNTPKHSTLEGTLGLSNFYCNVMSPGTFTSLQLDMVYNHGRCVLITGTRAWLMFPPAKDNLRLLLSFYKRELDADALFAQLRFGTVFVQRWGETVAIPPFAIFMVTSLDKSVSADWEITTSAALPRRLELISLFGTQWSRDPNSEHEELVLFANNLHMDLNTVINEVLKTTNSKLITSLMGNFESIEEEVRKLWNASGNSSWSSSLLFSLALAMYVKSKKQKKGLQCYLCKRKIDGLRAGQPVLEAHIRDEHWPKKSAEGLVQKSVVGEGVKPSTRKRGRTGVTEKDEDSVKEKRIQPAGKKRRKLEEDGFVV
ncbi:hypothetical protein BDV96DRAFT_304222 [Lophiotrema nucula]|uniref:JmjC domain-containing protein n=1 Tax=Lophiotrema nucula TaxID=690887 RepID=A0A6A5YKT2_9PLEO|nr:hypothetical protein BDV96DRAFT_304222 [Lophiotrema nucula]